MVNRKYIMYSITFFLYVLKKIYLVVLILILDIVIFIFTIWFIDKINFLNIL